MTLVGRLNLGFRATLPAVLQTEASECGLACLVMIVRFHGLQATLNDFRRTHGVSLKGATLKDLMNIAEAVGLAARPVRLEMHELPELRLPCILHWDLNHFVVLERADSRGAQILDPALGSRWIRTEELSRHFTGVALELTPSEQFASSEPVRPLPVMQLLGKVQGARKALAHVFLLALMIELFAMISPFFLSFIVDHVLVTADRDFLTTLAIGFALLLLMQTSVSALRAWLLMGLNASWRLQARGNLFRHLLHLPASFFETRHLGDVMSRFSSQEVILNAITSEMIEAVLDGIMTVITVIVMFILSPLLAAIVVGGAVFYSLMRWAFYRPLRDATSEQIVWTAKKDTHFLETLRGLRTIKLFGAHSARRTRWLNLLVEAINSQLTTEKIHLLFQTARQLLLGIITLIVIFLGALYVLEGALSVGLLLAFLAYKDQFFTRVSELINKVTDLAMLKLHAERLADIAFTKPETTEEEPIQAAGEKVDAPASLELSSVSFRYSIHEPYVLRNVSFRVRPGESVAIVGPSGCGKSTLVKLLSGLLAPEDGEILFDGRAVSSMGFQAYRSMLGVVMQDDQLFAGSLAENISFFAEAADMTLIQECAKLAAVHDDILAMPMGYNTLVGDMGMVLSGGQKQRVLVARALYRRPRVLILDEATSHLDIDREQALSEALRKLEVTRIIIAHRPETIRSAERIILLPALNAPQPEKTLALVP